MSVSDQPLADAAIVFATVLQWPLEFVIVLESLTVLAHTEKSVSAIRIKIWQQKLAVLC